MKKQKGLSLTIALALVLLLFLLSMVSLSTIESNGILRGSLYAQAVSRNAGEAGVQRAAPVLLADAQDNFIKILADGYAYPGNDPDASPNIYYSTSNFTGTFQLTFSDNDDLDNDIFTDTDQRIIVNASGRMVNGALPLGKTDFRVFTAYLGNLDYAQETGTAGSNSNFANELNISGDLDTVVEADPNANP